MSLFSKVTESKNPYIGILVYPLIIGFAVSLFMSALVSYLRNKGTFLEVYFSWPTLCAALGSTLVSYALRVKLLFGKDYDTLHTLRSVLSEFPPPLGEYAKVRLGESVKRIRSEIYALQHAGLSGQSLIRKMGIVESLIEDLGRGLTKDWAKLLDLDQGQLTRYWATTLDSPTQLRKEFDRFWSLQERVLKDVVDKRRIVVLTKEDLKQEIQSDGDALQDFIGWHKKERFRLLFLIDSERKFESETKQFLDHLQEKEVVTDFAILGDKWVYGEVTTIRDTTRDFKAANRLLRLYGKDFANEKVIEDYISFYKELWEKWRGDKWPVMVPEQILSECYRQEMKRTKLSETRQHYEQFIPTQNSRVCYEAIRKFVWDAKSEIWAVDIAPLKSKFLDWIAKKEYSEWMAATMNAAANNGCKCVRLYILESPLRDLANAQVAVQKIFRAQTIAGVKIFLTSANELWNSGIPVQDFTLVDNKLCISLGWDEPFSADSISIDNNLEHPVTFDWYKQIFENIVSSGLTKDLTEISEESLLRYLTTLKW